MESPADCRELDTVCSAVVGDAIGGPSLPTVVVVCEVNQVLDGDQDVQRKLVRPQKDGLQSYHQTMEQTSPDG